MRTCGPPGKDAVINLSRMVMLVLLLSVCSFTHPAHAATDLEKDFVSPPDSARPWVYWYFMDGNLSKEGMTADLEAMKKAGIGGAIFLEVDVGIPRGPVQFMSAPWQDALKHAVTEANRLGLQLALAAGPGWCGTGGPWVKPEQSMQHLVASETVANGPSHFDAILPKPKPRDPYFGKGTLTPELLKEWQDYYQDVVVLAFPTPAGAYRIPEIDEKALYFRDPYSSKPGTKPFLPAPANFIDVPKDQCIAQNQIVDLTSKLDATGRLTWDVPPGNWTIMRFGRTSTGQCTRPAPLPGLGFESDKFDASALDAHFDAFEETLFKAIGPLGSKSAGLTTLHFDSWEMGSQNWSAKFREEFTRRRGYDPLKYLPVMIGHVVDSDEISQRFLWDLRQTAQELIVENHATHLKELGRKHGLELSIEPYDLDPCADLKLGSVADVPMCEFWSKGYGFATEYSCVEATSIAHTHGDPIVGAEAFTATGDEQWHQYPGAMKAQADWALCAGINRFTFHRYQHQPWLDRSPGMTMGPYGVHWERTQTWWDMVPAFHLYLSRCQEMLRRGLPVADILYLTPEGAPQVFRPPSSAMQGDPPDRRGYNFDGCDPDTLIDRASVKDGRVTFPDGMSYRVLVLPEFETMTPGLLRKVKELAQAGATIVGAPPRKSPSLVGYPQCDDEVKQLASEIWGTGHDKDARAFGKGRIILDDAIAPEPATGKAFLDIYPSYDTTAKILAEMGASPDFESDGPIRFIHRRDGETEIYFLANRDSRPVSAKCRFRVAGYQPEWWNPLTGECRDLPGYEQKDGITTIPLRLDENESGFVIFRKPAKSNSGLEENCPEPKTFQTIAGPWEVAFDTRWGGPDKMVFDTLQDWSRRSEPGIKYYSGKARYRTTFDCDVHSTSESNTRLSLVLGDVKNLASVKLNGTDLGVAWCAPFRLEIPTGLLREHANVLEITVANLWINRLIGDAGLPEEKRLTWTTWNPFKPDSPLVESGLIGPVSLQKVRASE